MTERTSRRGFLRGLAALPLIGGGVALTGRPTAAAVPITGGMMATYVAWLHYELRAVAEASFGDRRFIPAINPGSGWHDFGRWREEGIAAQRRAPVILSAAGVPLTSAEADEQWGGPLA
ncbi:hypothetical protein [Methylobacterium sp. ID0610]|uniref:hypothetical protein n=1 Tax=Methylobacterium carpenticola TaxID=3344827 RepID=UPI003688E93B